MPAGDDRFSGRLLYPMYLLAVLSRRHDLARRTTLDVMELADQLLLRLTPSFASHGWFDAACHVAHVRPRILHESVAAQTLIALAKAGHGIALVPSPVRIARAGVSIAVVTHRELPLGVWTVAAWDPQRHLAPFASKFIEEVAGNCQRDYPGHEYVRKAPRLPKPKAG